MRWEAIEGGLRVLAPAKLNLYLEVGPARADGFHEIDSVFQAVTLFDELELRRTRSDSVVLEEDGIRVGERNLVHRAAVALRRWARDRGHAVGGVRIRLRKRIPQGAGLGGGSSDAAATLVALARLWELEPPPDELCGLAATLGSDVPFFLLGGAARAQGRGEKLTSLSAVFDVHEPLYFVLAYPRVEISSGFVYKQLDASRPVEFTLTVSSRLDSMSATSIRSQLGCGKLYFNRLERVVYSAFPEIQSLRARMADEPFLQVLLSGSGSTLYGVCRSAEEAERISASLCARVDAEIYAVRGERRIGGGPPMPGSAFPAGAESAE